MARLAAGFILLVFPIVALGEHSCYSTNIQTDEVEHVHHCDFCTAIYVVETGDLTLGCGQRGPSKVTAFKHQYDFASKSDCQKSTESILGTEETEELYVCLCFTGMCNFPFTFSEFRNRGHSIRPIGFVGNGENPAVPPRHKWNEV